MVQHSICAFAQIEKLATQYNAYSTKHLQEKIYVHTDKENYITGEIIWFKLYDIDAMFHRPLSLSKVAYVEVLDNTHKQMLQGAIELRESMGEGSFLIPYTLQSGNYIFRCYTSLMQNDSAEFYFEKEISIINPLKKPNWSIPQPAVFSVQFFPEGGNLVEGLESKIGFKVQDQYGQSISAKGFIEDESKNHLLQFGTDRFGMGQFLFKPLPGKKYQASVDINGKSFVAELPAIHKIGTVLRLNENAAVHHQITVESSQEIKSVFLLIHNRQVLKQYLQQELINGKTQFLIPDSLMGEGINQITIFDEQFHPLCERLYFKKPSQTLKLTVDLSANSYEPRSKVELGINAQDLQLPTESNLCVSVYLLDSLQKAPNSNILSYTWLESDLKGSIESPEYYFSDSVDLSRCTENLMLTQGWRRFNWEDVESNSPKMDAHHAELNGHLIFAKVTKKQDGKPAEGITVYMSLPGDKPLFKQANSDKNGLVLFNIAPFFGSNQLILQTNSHVDSVYNIELLNPYSNKYSSRSLPNFELKESFAALLKSHSIQSQVGNIYYTAQQQTFNYPISIDTVAFFGKPTHRYYLDEYTRFITMEEVIKEYVEGVRLKKSGDQFNLKLLDERFGIYFETEPLVLLDGLPVFDINQLINYDPLKIKKMEVLNQQFFQNKMLWNGVLSCNTYKGDLEGFTIDPNALVIAYEGLQLKREFYQPIYDDNKKAQNRLPDFRNVLVWQPNLCTDKQGKSRFTFYSSDLTGQFIIVINAINKEGKMGYIYQYLSVNN